MTNIPSSEIEKMCRAAGLTIKGLPGTPGKYYPLKNITKKLNGREKVIYALGVLYFSVYENGDQLLTSRDICQIVHIDWTDFKKKFCKIHQRINNY